MFRDNQTKRSICIEVEFLLRRIRGKRNQFKVFGRPVGKKSHWKHALK